MIKSFIIIIIIFSNCTSSNKLTAPSTNIIVEFDKQGHRGCRGLMPENTIPAMIHALELGVTTLEMDVVITKDKKVILSHEPWFGRDITTKPDGTHLIPAEERKFNIYNMTYAETQSFDVGMKPHAGFPKQQKLAATKPLLSDVIDTVNGYLATARRSPLFYNIETKTTPQSDNIFHPEPKEFVDLLMQVIKEKHLQEKVIIQSFDFRTIRYLHKEYPGIKTAMLINGGDTRSLDEQLRDLGFVPAIYSPAFRLVTASLIEDCHKRNMKIIPWTVNDKQQINSLKALGVDGVISDYPDLF